MRARLGVMRGILVFVAAVGCDARDRQPAAATAPMPSVVTIIITATDFHFDAPDSVPAGLTTLHLVTQGEQSHQVAMLRISGGKSFADFLARIAQPGPPPAWVTVAGGVDPPRPGGSASVTMELEAGTYALLCFMAGPDGVPHVLKGMSRELRVVPSRAPRAAEPVATDTLTAADLSFTNSAPLTAGTRTFLFINKGPQPHEVVFARLSPGRTAAQMVAWFLRPVGAPPGELLGGVFAIRPDQRAWVTMEFTPGEYALICFYPDVVDGRPHAAHGMVRQVTVH